MNPKPAFAPLCQSFFAKRLIAQRQASPHTVAAYAQTFRLLMRFAQERLWACLEKMDSGLGGQAVVFCV